MAQTIAFLLCAVPITAALNASILNFQFNGNSITGSILVDNSISDSNSDPQKGLYHEAIVSYQIEINGAHNNLDQPVFTTLQGSSGDVVIGIEADGVGACSLSTDCLAFILGQTFLDEGPIDYDLTFYYPAGSLSSDALPGAVPSSGPGILRSDVQQFFLGFACSASIAPIPEPTSIQQVVLGLAVVFIGAVSLATSRNRRYTPMHSA
jgi:hypothetical protein